MGDDTWYYLADSLNWCSIEAYAGMLTLLLDLLPRVSWSAPLTVGHAAIICGSASTFRILIKTYMPRLWDSRYYGSNMKGHLYNHSSTGDFALKPFGPSRSHHLSRDRPRGLHDMTYADCLSEEAPRLDSDQKALVGGAKKGILMKKEFSMQVTDAGSSSQAHVAPLSQV